MHNKDKGLKDGKMDLLSKFLVTMRQVAVYKPLTELDINDTEVVKSLDSHSRGPMFKSTGWLQGWLSLSSFQGR